MREFIDLKIRAFIRVGESDVESFFREHTTDFPGREYDDVRDEIEKYLTEKELNERLKELLRELRAKAYIRIYLDKNP
jgi:phosphoserine phosphatase